MTEVAMGSPSDSYADAAPRVSPRFIRPLNGAELRPPIALVEEQLDGHEVVNSIVIRHTDDGPPTEEECLLALAQNKTLDDVVAIQHPFFVRPIRTGEERIYVIHAYRPATRHHLVA